MPCYSPIAARRNGGGGVELLGSVHDPSARRLSTLRIACGRCIGCRLKYSQMWAIRCVHEASLYDKNCVVTLTYDSKHLPGNGSLHYPDFQLFLKRLRQHRRRFFLKHHFKLKRFSDLTSTQARHLVTLSKIRFFCGGEYGDQNLRPHFHACLFNYDFPDKTVCGSRDGRPNLWHSVLANSLWQKGDTRIGVLDFDSAAYVARYVIKKVYGDLADDHYRVGTDEELKPEFACMSRRPGIGRPWIEKFWPEVRRDLSVWSRGHRVFAPGLYTKYVESIVDCTDARLALADKMKKLDSRSPRLLAAARIASARLGLSRRKL
ncbi:MAG: replication initiator protein [Microvirus sp.]|nr:MAG: replication initiator protein [Microvirus sp.]